MVKSMKVWVLFLIIFLLMALSFCVGRMTA